MIGETVAHYRIVSKLGSGGMGVVYKAEDNKLLRFVALKFLPADSAADPQTVERFVREARAASALNHPHICTIYEIGEHEGRPFIAMEFLDGQSLRQRLAAGPMPLDEILDLGTQIADALAAAHVRGIVHRDIKSANIFITRHGSAKVLDFGLAKMQSIAPAGSEGHSALPTASADPTRTGSGSVAGTATYMSPEQIRGQELDARSDLFSFGAVLYEMATGRTPFSGDTAGILFDSILNRAPQPPSRLNPEVSPQLEEVIGKALEKDRDLRYQSAAELRADLKRLKRDSESHASDEALPVSLPAPRWRKLLPVALVLVLLAAVAGGLLLYRLLRPSPPASSGTWQQLTFFTDSAVYPALSPDGRMLAFIRGQSSFFGPGQIYLKLLPDGDPVEMTHDSLMKLAPVFSPDGSRIAYGTVSPYFDTWEVPVLNGQPRLLLPNSSSLTWIDSGKALLFSEIKTGIHMAVVTTDEARGHSRDVYVPPSDRGMVHHSYLSPDGRWVLIVEMDSRGILLPCRVVPFQGNAAPVAVGPPGGICTTGAWSPDGQWVYVSASVGGKSHIWRQKFPDGAPQQVTSGTTEEEGIAMAPDGKSFVTSVGTTDSTLWIHHDKGERQITSQGTSGRSAFSRDGTRLYYLNSTGQSSGNELWGADLTDGKFEKLLPGYSIDQYSISADGKQVVFSQTDSSGHSNLWIAPTDHRSSPRQFVSPVNEDWTDFLPDGDIVFRAPQDGYNALYRMHPDGSGRHRIGPPRIIDFMTMSVDGRWAIASADGPDPEHNSAFYAFPVDGGQPALLCLTVCTFGWDSHGNYLYVGIYQHDDLGTYALPVNRKTGLPDLPAKGISDFQQLKAVRGSIFFSQAVDSAASPSLYAFLRRTTRRNLYRVPVQ